MSAEETERSSIGARIAASLFLAAAVLLLIPWRPAGEPYALDRAWALVLHEAFLRGLAFGREIVFSFGPWGFLWRGYHPATYPIVIAAWALFAAVFVDSVWAIGRKAAARAIAALVVALAAVVVLSRGAETLLMTLPLLWFLAGRERVLSIRFVALTIATTLAAFGKFSLLLFLAPLALFLAFDELFRQGRFPISSAAVGIALLAWWVAAGQRLADLGAFLGHGFEIAVRFAGAMSIEPASTLAPLALFAAASLLLLILTAVGARAAARPWPWLDALAFAVMLFFAFKTGFVRWDSGHAALGYGALLLLTLIGLPLVWRGLRARHPRLAAAAALVPLLIVAATAIDGEDRKESGLSRALRDAITVAASAWRDDPLRLRDEHERFVREEEARALDLPLRGTVDVYPTLASVVAARPLYAPRPVPQSYSAYSARLARLNASHLVSRPPDQILFDVAPIDGRFPSLDDALSWPELLARYRVSTRGASFVLLERRERPRAIVLRPIGTRVVEAGEPLALPPLPDPLWAEIRVEETLLGRAASFFFRAPSVRLHVHATDGRSDVYRLPIELAAGGFLLSPLVRDRGAFAALAEDPAGNSLPRPATIRVEAPRLFFDPKVRISIATIRLGAVGSSR